MFAIHKYGKLFPWMIFFPSRSFAIMRSKTIKSKKKAGEKQANQRPLKSANFIKTLTKKEQQANQLPSESANSIKILATKEKQAKQLLSKSASFIKNFTKKEKQAKQLLSKSANFIKILNKKEKQVNELPSKSTKFIKALAKKEQHIIFEKTTIKKQINNQKKQISEGVHLQNQITKKTISNKNISDSKHFDWQNEEVKNSIVAKMSDMKNQISRKGKNQQDNSSILSGFFRKKAKDNTINIEDYPSQQSSIKLPITNKPQIFMQTKQKQININIVEIISKPIDQQQNLQSKEIKSVIIAQDQIVKDKQSEQKMLTTPELVELQTVMIQLANQTEITLNNLIISQRIKSLKILLQKYMKIILDANLIKNIEDLLNYIDFLKNLTFAKILEQQSRNVIYNEIDQFMLRKKNKQIMKKLILALSGKDILDSRKLRSVCLIKHMSSPERNHYLQMIAPLLKHLNKAGIIMLIYEQIKYKYDYSYKILNQIYNNTHFINITDLQGSYIKMQFIEKMKGHFLSSEQVLYKMFDYVQQQKDETKIVDFDKLIKIVKSQLTFASSHNAIVSVKKGFKLVLQKYNQQLIRNGQFDSLKLIQIYLNFQEFESSQVDEYFLSKVIGLDVSKFVIENTNFPTYKRMLMRILKGLEKKIKYEYTNSPNQRFTTQIIRFLRKIIPKYIQIWPEVIFQVNHISFEIFQTSKLDTKKELLQLFEKKFKQILNNKKEDITLQNTDFTLKLLKFLTNIQFVKIPIAAESIYISLLLIEQINRKINGEPLTNKQLEIYYLCLALMSNNDIKFNQNFSLINQINIGLIQKQISYEINQNNQKRLIQNLNHKIIWLSLCSAQAKNLGCIINQSLLQEFINKKLYFMINSLEYVEVYQILVFSLNFKEINPQIYERLLFNLSTFIIAIKNQSQKQVGAGSFYLDHKYASYYPKICKLILNNQSKFKAISNKNCFIVVQIMLTNQFSLSNQEIIIFLNILSDPSYLSSSMEKLLANTVFTSEQLRPYQSSQNMRSFKYYNRSLLTYFGGITYKSQIHKILSRSTLSQQEINRYLSEVEVYKTIFMDGQLNIQFNLPEPVTDIMTFKHMFVCQKIYNKIKRFNFDFNQNWIASTFNNPSFSFKLKEINFLDEINYINRQKLIPHIEQSSFKISSRKLPQYIKMKIWTVYKFQNRAFQIEEKDLTLNNYKFQDKILGKICQSLFGSKVKVNEVISEFKCDENIVNSINSQNIRNFIFGAAIKIKDVITDKTILTILCSNNKNYKLMHICAFILAQTGVNVVIVKQNQNIQPLLQFIKQNILSKAQQIQQQTLNQEKKNIDQILEDIQS